MPAEKDIEKSGLAIGRRPGIRGRLYTFSKRFSGSLFVTLVLLILLTISFKPRVVYIYNDQSAPLVPLGEGDTSTWHLQGWNTTSKCTGTAVVNLEGADDQECTPTSSSKKIGQLQDGPIALTNVTWGGDNTYALCLFTDAGCSTFVARYVSDETCADGHDATYFSVVDVIESCPSAK